MSQFNLILVSIGFIVLFLGLFSGFLKKKGLSEPFIALLIGLILGQNGLLVLTPHTWGESGTIFKEVSRLTLAIGLMGVALRVPGSAVVGLRRDITILLLLVMPGMLVVSGFLAYSIIEISIWGAVLIGAIVAPTDPVVSSSIVTGEVAKKNLPERIRNVISLESGFNDGLGYPFVMLAYLFLTFHSSPVEHWFMKVWLWEVLGAAVFGVILGISAGKLLLWSERKNYIEKPSILAYTIALSFLTVSLLKIIHTDGILGVFVAGIVLNRTISATQRAQEERVTEGIDKFFTLPIFALLGVYLPIQEWLNAGWTLFALAVVILLLKRLPFILLLWKSMKSIHNVKEAIFVGWFGPVGVAALLYAHLKPEIQEMEMIWHVVSLVVTTSIVLHGLTATPLSRLLAQTDDDSTDA